MRRTMRIAAVAGTAGALALGGTAAAFAAQGGGQHAQPPASCSHPAPAGAAAGYRTAPVHEQDNCRDSQHGVRAPVNAHEARHLAQHRLPGGLVTEVERDSEHGRTVWEVDITRNGREYEMKINAVTGQVITVRCDAGTGQGAED